MNTHKGFTLIELLIVITIIGILAVALLPRLLEGPQRARDTARVADLNNLSTLLQTYNIDFGSFPESPGECTQTGNTVEPTSKLVEALTTTSVTSASYIASSNFPRDPQVGNNTALCDGTINAGYWYKSLTDSGVPKAGYVLAAGVENVRQANANAPALKAVIQVDGDIATSTNKVLSDGRGNAIGLEAVYAVTSR